MPKKPQKISYGDSRVLVTGGASGFGLELTKLFSAEGARVLVTDIHNAAPQESLPPGASYLKVDVRSGDDWERAREWVESSWGGLDVLINNAGVAAGGRIDVSPMSDWARIVDTNLFGAVRGCRTFTPVFKRQRHGQIVNVASLAGLVHAPHMSAYNTVKAGVVALSETLSAELAPWNIDVSVICPSFFRTNLSASLQGGDLTAENMARDLITQAPRSAQQVASIAYKAMRSRKFLILTDTEGRIGYNAKRYAYPVYRKSMSHISHRLETKRSPIPTILSKIVNLILGKVFIFKSDRLSLRRKN